MPKNFNKFKKVCNENDNKFPHSSFLYSSTMRVPQYFLESLCLYHCTCSCLEQMRLAENGPMAIRKRRLLLVHPGGGNQCQAATSLRLIFSRLGRTAKKKCRKFEANIPRKGISGPQSQFPDSCVCERITVYIPTMELPFLLEEICGQILGIYKSITDT